MSESRMLELAEQLLHSARTRRLGWHEGVIKGSYVVDFPDVSLSIREWGNHSFGLTLINDEGDEIESFETYTDDFGEPITPSVLPEIYDIARRQTLDIDGNIDKALEYLRRE